jgi:hypothetical protein
MIALLAGCGGGMAPAQLGATGTSTPAQLRFMGAGAAHRFQSTGANAARSWMAPDAKKSKTLLYVADQDANDVDVYSYPAGKLKGTLTGISNAVGRLLEQSRRRFHSQRQRYERRSLRARRFLADPDA